MIAQFKDKLKNKLKSICGTIQLEQEIEKKNLQISYLQNCLFDLKNNIKKDGKINVVFVCHRPQIWCALETVCDALLNDSKFNVKIVAVPNKKQLSKYGFNHDVYESEGAEEYFMERYSCTVLGYNYETKEWLDLYSLKPDYVFFQTPYNICRPPIYQSDVVSTFARLCYVHYGMPFMNGAIADDTTPPDFFKDVTYHFIEFPEMESYYTTQAKKFGYEKNYNQILSGYPKLDKAGFDKKRIGDWSFKGDSKKFRILWTPRWNTGEGNCTFFEYKDKLIELAESDDRIELLFRPHPQAFAEYVASGAMSQQEVSNYIKRYENCPNAAIDYSGDYLNNFYTADLLISDESSIIPEFFLTKNPIIMTSHETHFNCFAQKLERGFYFADDWKQINDRINILVNGKDEKSAIREGIINKEFYMPPKGAGYEIMSFLKKH